jgi:glycosyltransferase involved in cell wall biosynthesis
MVNFHIPPLVSVITVVRNRRYFIERAIDSVIQQRYPNIEHIIIDGGSTDGTIEIIKKYESKLTHWESQQDSGMYFAINRGLELINGALWTCLNSDDYYDSPDAIHHVMDAYRGATSNVGIIFGDLIVGGDIPNERKRLMQVNYSRLLAFQHGSLLPHPAAFLTRQVREKIGKFDTRYNYCADYDYLLRATKHFETLYLNIPLTVMIRHKDSFSISSAKEMNIERHRIVAEHEAGLAGGEKLLLRVLKFILLVRYVTRNPAMVRRRLSRWATRKWERV